MIYFLVNNNYHLDLDKKLANQLSDQELGLIQVPYSLNVITESEIFSSVIYFPHKIIPSIINFFIHPFRIIDIQNMVKEKLKPNSNDILLVHTDMDLLNQYIIEIFYNAKAKIFLLEDGTATMTMYNIRPQKPNIKERIKAIILQYAYKFKYTQIANYGSYTIPVMKDFVFNGVIVNFGESILRDIPLFKIAQKKENLNIIHKSGSIFFNQPLYFFYLTEDEYLKFVSDLLQMSKNFTPFYFKFHPSDSEGFKRKMTKLIRENYTDITIIPENEIAENIVNKYPVRYAITINSTSALNLINKGLVPIFLNNLFNNAYSNENSEAFKRFLKSIDCNSPQALSEVKPGFFAFSKISDNENRQSIKTILNL